MTNPVTLRYHQHDLEAVEMGGQMWLRGPQIAAPLGFADEKFLRQLYNRHADEFTHDEARIIPLMTAGGMQDVLVFSLRGARLLALLARTPQAKAFRKWVLDVLEGRFRPRGAASALGSRPLSSDARTALETAMRMIEDDHPAQVKLREIVATGEGLAADPELTALAEEWEDTARRQRVIMKEFNRIRFLAARRGYSDEAVKAEVKRRKRFGAQPVLTYQPEQAGADA